MKPTVRWRRLDAATWRVTFGCVYQVYSDMELKYARHPEALVAEFVIHTQRVAISRFGSAQIH